MSKLKVSKESIIKSFSRPLTAKKIFVAVIIIELISTTVSDWENIPVKGPQPTLKPAATLIPIEDMEIKKEQNRIEYSLKYSDITPEPSLAPVATLIPTSAMNIKQIMTNNIRIDENGNMITTSELVPAAEFSLKEAQNTLEPTKRK